MTSSGASTPSPERRFGVAPWLVVAAAVAWNLVNLRALTLAAPYANDSTLHEQMVRFATLQFRAGELPLTSWYPYLGLGSPHFLHYQSLGAMITGAIGLAIDPNTAFRWSLYLLVSLWPISIYCAGRLFGLGRAGAASAAAVSPFLSSITGVGYEQKAYVWIGYGVWAQLWAAFTLPLAWGFSWRAIREGRGVFWAVLLTALTVALHFETGYLALIPPILWPFLTGRSIGIRARRMLTILVAALLASAWVIVPLIAQRNWAATPEIFQHTPFVDGYGATRTLGWLFTGKLLDFGRFPVISLLAAVGFLAACVRWRSDRAGPPLVVAFVVSLVLSFGRTTFGSLVVLLPGSGDIFFRRLSMGADLAAILLAGAGAAAIMQLAGLGFDRLARGRPAGGGRVLRRARHPLIVGALAAAVGIGVLAPAWVQFRRFDHANTVQVDAQRRADAREGVALDRLAAVADRAGGGRIYAPPSHGLSFAVGEVPVNEYLASRDVEQVGYTLRTASLMTNPEFYFDARNLSDYILFGVRYVILPARSRPAVPARRMRCAGPFCLWTVADGGYLHLGRVVGSYAADRTNLGVRSLPLLRSRLAANGNYLRLLYGAHAPARPPARVLLAPSRGPSPGAVAGEHDALLQGRVSAKVRLTRRAVVVLSASFDPGWKVTVDGHDARTLMIAPALVAVQLSRGTHRVTFQYVGFPYYPELLALTLLALAGAFVLQRRARFERWGE